MPAETATRSAPPSLHLLEISSIADQVYDVLLRRIVSGDLRPGTRLRQEAFAEELGVSRTPLREALRRLASEGFVHFAVNHGVTVAERDLSDPLAVRTARLHLEPAIARLAAEVRDPEGMKALAGVVGRAAASDPGSLHAVDAEFHLAVARATGNPQLVRFAQILWFGRPDPAAYADGAALLAAHAATAAAIEQGDGAQAERLSTVTPRGAEFRRPAP